MSILSRKRDLIYFIFFLTHIPLVCLVDLYPLYPTALRPGFMTDIRTYYINTFNDQFFISPPAWFMLYIYMELFFHLPVSIWAAGALLRNDAKVPIHLLIWAVQTAVTTATCIADYMSWSGHSNAAKLELGKLYVPYLALSVFMGVDMFTRLDTALGGKTTPPSKKKN